MSERPTPNESVEIGWRSWELFNEGRADEFWALFDDDCVVATDRRWPGGGEFRGKDAFRHFTAQFLEAFQGLRFEPSGEAEPVGDAVIFRGQWIGEGATSGIETASVPFSVVLRTRDGLITAAHFFFDDAEAREFARSQT